MIKQVFTKRAHVMHYSSEIVPTKKEIEEILTESIPLATSKQKAFAYKAYIVGTKGNSNKEIYNWCEGYKVNQDIIRDENLPEEKEKPWHTPNKGLMHLASAPWTLIWTPMDRKPNAYYEKAFSDTKSWWQMDEKHLIESSCRGQCLIEGSMMAQMIVGITIEKGWDSSFNICFPSDGDQGILPSNNKDHKKYSWSSMWPDIEYKPFLIQTIGKAKRYLYQERTDKQRLLNTNPTMEDLYKFI